MIRIFIGYDPREAVAYHVLVHSIQTRASQPVSIAPLLLSQLRGVFHRPRHPLQSTDFSFSRFLVPSLCGFEGWALFVDCDMLVLDDIAGLWALRDERYAVMVVKHNHVPREDKKFLGAPQSAYHKKNWSSVMLFNTARCRALSPEYVNAASGLDLHQFLWLGDDALIGELPPRWNHLVGYDEPVDNPALVHFTLGGPYFKDSRRCRYSADWFWAREDMLNAGDN